MHILMFPGQGSQYVGMGEELFPKYDVLCQKASEKLGYSILDLCLKDPEDRLNTTAYTQPALYFVCCLMYLEHISRGGSASDPVMGHSLGLFPALYAAGVFDLLDGLEIVAMRGKLMGEIRGYGMLAVLGDRVDQLDHVLARLDFFDLDMANDNTPSQVVLSGPESRIESVAPLLEAQDYRCIRLPVSGAFHSRYMEAPRQAFVHFLMGKSFEPPKRLVISSTSGEIIKHTHLLEEITYQLTKPVRWRHTIQALSEKHGGFTYEEIGPKRVLTNLTQACLMEQGRAAA